MQPPPTCRRSSNSAPASLPTHVARMEVELEKMREVLAVSEQRDADKQHEIDPLRRKDVQQTNCAQHHLLRRGGGGGAAAGGQRLQARSGISVAIV